MSGDQKKWPVRTILAIALVCCGGSVLISWWIVRQGQPAKVGESAPLPPAKETPAPATVPVDVGVVYVHPPKVKAALNLPAKVVTDPAKVVTATGKLSAEQRPYTLTAVLDTGTGHSEIFARPDPRPWFGFEQHGGASLAYGYKTGTPVIRLAAHHDFIRLGALHAGLSATLDTDGDWFTGLGVRYAW